MTEQAIVIDLQNEPGEEYLGTHGSTRFYKNPRGIDICQYFWPALPGIKPKGIVVLAHGHGGYLQFDWLKSQGAGKPCIYAGSFVEQLNAAGYAVCGNDDRGAGRSGGLRCYCDSFEDYVTDVLEVCKVCTTLSIASFEAGLPKFMCGLSRGGCAALIAVLKAPTVFSGVICLAPMVSLEKVAKRGLNPYLKPLGKFLSWAAPRAALLSTNRNTLYPDLQEAYDKDPNCYHDKTRVRNAQEYLRATEWLVAHQSELKLPLLLFHSDGDDQTDPEGTKRLYEAAKSTDKTFVGLTNMWHILLKEPGHEQVERQLLEWLDKHCTPEAVAAAVTEEAPAAAKEATVEAPAAGKEVTEEAPAAAKEAAEEAPAATKEATEEAPAAAKEATEKAPAAAKEATEEAPAAAKEATE